LRWQWLFAGAWPIGADGEREPFNFTTGYIIELHCRSTTSSSLRLIFAWFHIPVKFQHRLLFLGILGALVMRGAMIAAGVEPDPSIRLGALMSLARFLIFRRH